MCSLGLKTPEYIPVTLAGFDTLLRIKMVQLIQNDMLYEIPKSKYTDVTSCTEFLFFLIGKTLNYGRKQYQNQVKTNENFLHYRKELID